MHQVDNISQLTTVRQLALFPKAGLRSHSVVCVLLAILGGLHLHAQQTTTSAGSFDFNTKGIIFRSADSSAHVIMRFRMQNWVVYTSTPTEDGEPINLSAGTVEAAVRRLRLRFGGSLFDPRLSFNLQLSFSRNDMDWRDTEFPNIIRDAMVFWNFTPDLQVSFGQTKLPGNRQRVTSSGDIEFADRSIVNGAFTLDRDFGLQGYWRPVSGDQIVNIRAAISGGDGRNQPPIPGGGLAYTARVEFLPLGAFTDGGDYFEGDLEREPHPKLSLGVSAQHNERMTKTRGTLGTPLYEQRSAQTIYADGVFKYSGFSMYGEYATRLCANPITTSGTDVQAVFAGNGYLIQSSFVFPSMISVAARFATTIADDALAGLPEYTQVENVGANVGYYINAHRIKCNLEVGTMNVRNLDTDIAKKSLYGRFNLELGI